MYVLQFAIVLPSSLVNPAYFWFWVLVSLCPVGIRICDTCLRVFILGCSLCSLSNSLILLSQLLWLWKFMCKRTRRIIQVMVSWIIWVGKYILWMQESSYFWRYIIHIRLLKILKIHMEKQTEQKHAFSLLTVSVAILYKISLIGNILWETSP